MTMSQFQPIQIIVITHFPNIPYSCLQNWLFPLQSPIPPSGLSRPSDVLVEALQLMTVAVTSS